MKSMVTDIKVRGDKQIEQIPSIKDKALRINLNENIFRSQRRSAQQMTATINDIIKHC